MLPRALSSSSGPTRRLARSPCCSAGFCSFAFGAVATIMTWIVYPTLEKLMGRLPRNAANVLFIVVVVFFVLVFSLYCVNVAIPGMTPEESSALFGY